MSSTLPQSLGRVPKKAASPPKDESQKPPRKRKRTENRTEISIGLDSDVGDGSDNVKLWLEQVENHSFRTQSVESEESTHRPSCKRTQTRRPESGSPQPSSPARLPPSNHISPQNELNDLERCERGLRIRDIFNLHKAPLSLASLLSAMRKVSRGRGILPMSMREELRNAADMAPALIDFVADDTCFGITRHHVGDAPLIEEVISVLAEGGECQENFHPEATWNMNLHQEILKLALWKRGMGRMGAVTSFMACSTASIIPEYLEFAPAFKKVDFCIYIEATLNPEKILLRRYTSPLDTNEIMEARDKLPCGVLNHTAYLPLRARPIALSIVTKQSNESWTEAALRLGVWQAAQWNFLQRLLPFASAEDKVEYSGQILPDFIPGIIIEGHEWYFLLSTKDYDQAVVWSKIAMGTTSTAMGIYQIILGLQTIRQWIESNYWPRVKKLIAAAGRDPD